MTISGHYDFGDSTRLTDLVIQQRLQELVGSKGRVDVGSSNKGTPIAIIYDVQESDKIDVFADCDLLAKQMNAEFHAAIDGGTVHITV